MASVGRQHCGVQTVCLEEKSITYDFEKSFCMVRPEVWLHEAMNLFYSADVLGEFEHIKQAHPISGRATGHLLNFFLPT
jgi:hypothetical protein